MARESGGARVVLLATAMAAFASGARPMEFLSQKGAVALSFLSAEWQGYGYLPLGKMPMFKELEALMDRYAPNVKSIFAKRDYIKRLVTNAPPQGRSATDFLYTYSPVIAPTVVLAETYERLVPDAVMKTEQATTTLYEPYLVKDFVPPLKFSVEQNARVSALSADLNTLNATMSAKWISGGADVDADWDRYQADLKRMGVEELAKLQQEAYDTYLRGGK